MEAFDTAFSIHFAPLLPVFWIGLLALVATIFFALGLYKRKRGTLWRALCMTFFLIALCQPSVMEELRQPVKDVAVIILDQSPSQSYGNRTNKSAEALEALRRKLGSLENLELRVIEAPSSAGLIINETRVFDALDMALADIPQKRRAGVIVISDGQIHDIPADIQDQNEYGPVHLLLSGSRQDKDRQLIILEAPSYGIVGKTVTIKYRIEDTANIGQSSASVRVKRQNENQQEFSVPVNQDQTLELNIEHAGQNVFELETQIVDGEITAANNKNALMINGVRERLRVLLVSGQPHSGGRTWRDLLTSDPSVDLVHFTILREPEKLDATPQDELSLIAFPFRELFEVKLYDFDLIVFDRYKLNRILPDFYFKNIADYVKEGGAFLEASGPSFSGADSIYYTALMDVLPGEPTGEMINRPFRPTLSDLGRQHPVTGSLIWKGMSAGTTSPEWGQWLRQVSLNRKSGEILMNGDGNNPLLILDRVEKGRVAQLASDHIWLWSRGYDEGGPHTELLRRIVHWLMKEPELDERALNITVNDNRIIIKSRDFAGNNPEILMSAPNGDTSTLTLQKQSNGYMQSEIIADQIGIYSFEDSYGETRFAVVGDLNPPELRGVITTDKKMLPLINATSGHILWLEDNARPDIRFLTAERRSYGGNGWIGLRENHEFNVQGVTQKDILPDWLMLSLLLGMAILTWWIEGRSR